MKKIIGLVALAVPILAQSAIANEWINGVQVVKVGAYQHSSAHFVWLSSGVAAECQAAVPDNPTLNFTEQAPGGKSMMATLLSAVATKATVDVQVSGCDIIEVYFR